MKTLMWKTNQIAISLSQSYQEVRPKAQVLRKKGLILGAIMAVFLALADNVLADASQLNTYLDDRSTEFKEIVLRFSVFFGIMAFVTTVVFVLKHDYSKAFAGVVVFLICLTSGTLLNSISFTVT